MKIAGLYWNDNTKPIYQIQNKYIVLNKWDGDKWYDCFQLQNNLINIASKRRFEVIPEYTQVNEDTFELTNLILN